MNNCKLESCDILVNINDRNDPFSIVKRWAVVPKVPEIPECHKEARRAVYAHEEREPEEPKEQQIGQ